MIRHLSRSSDCFRPAVLARSANVTTTMLPCCMQTNEPARCATCFQLWRRFASRSPCWKPAWFVVTSAAVAAGRGLAPGGGILTCRLSCRVIRGSPARLISRPNSSEYHSGCTGAQPPQYSLRSSPSSAVVGLLVDGELDHQPAVARDPDRERLAVRGRRRGRSARRHAISVDRHRLSKTEQRHSCDRGYAGHGQPVGPPVMRSATVTADHDLPAASGLGEPEQIVVTDRYRSMVDVYVLLRRSDGMILLRTSARLWRPPASALAVARGPGPGMASARAGRDAIGGRYCVGSGSRLLPREGGS